MFSISAIFCNCPTVFKPYILPPVARENHVSLYSLLLSCPTFLCYSLDKTCDFLFNPFSVSLTQRWGLSSEVVEFSHGSHGNIPSFSFWVATGRQNLATTLGEAGASSLRHLFPLPPLTLCGRDSFGVGTISALFHLENPREI